MLWIRTEGLAARVAEEVDDWITAGIARWDGALLCVDRDSLDRLEVGQRVLPLASETTLQASTTRLMLASCPSPAARTRYSLAGLPRPVGL